jgi:hypothetical protein
LPIWNSASEGDQERRPGPSGPDSAPIRPLVFPCSHEPLLAFVRLARPRTDLIASRLLACLSSPDLVSSFFRHERRRLPAARLLALLDHTGRVARIARLSGAAKLEALELGLESPRDLITSAEGAKCARCSRKVHGRSQTLRSGMHGRIRGRLVSQLSGLSYAFAALCTVPSRWCPR